MCFPAYERMKTMGLFKAMFGDYSSFSMELDELSDAESEPEL